MKKNLFEKIFFIFINICFTSLGVYLILFPMMTLSDIIFKYRYHESFVTSENDGLWFMLLLGMFIVYLLLKSISFLILYKCKKQFPYIHTFFDKIRIDRKFMWKILGIILLADIIIYHVYWICDGFRNYFDFTITIPFALILNYLIFLLFYHPVKQDKIAKDGTIRQGKIANVITNIFIWLNIILIIFVFLLCCLYFIS